MIPVDGMTVSPYGADDPLMLGAWLDFVRWAIRDLDVLAKYKAETGRDLLALTHGSPLDRMVDEATGRYGVEVAAFCDWATSGMWGEQDDADDTP